MSDPGVLLVSEVHGRSALSAQLLALLSELAQGCLPSFGLHCLFSFRLLFARQTLFFIG